MEWSKNGLLNQHIMERTQYKKQNYPSVLDHKPGFFLGWFLYRFFKRFQLDENMVEKLRNMNREGTVIYGIKYRGHLDYLLYHFRFRMKRLPFPKIAFDLNMFFLLPISQLLRIVKFHISYFLKHNRMPSPFDTGFYKNEIMNGTTSLISLLDPVGFTRHFVYSEAETLHFLLEIQKSMDKPIFFVPLIVLYSKTPEKQSSSLPDIFFGYKDKPGIIRKIGLFFRYSGKAFIDFGEPQNLKSYLETSDQNRPLEDLAVELRRTLIESIDAQKRVILGPIMKSREQFMETTLKDPKIIHTIERLAGNNPQKAKKLRKEAEGYFDEIAADYNSAYINFFFKILTWGWKKLYEGIEVDPNQLAMVRDWARKGPVIYIPSHKSHIDYLILNYVLYEYHTHIPRIVAGKNLTFWPMGHIFKKSGAFFIRRTFKGAKLYTEVFERYVKALLEEGHPLEFFIEGGRSRSGKIVLPKIGFLSILLRAQQEGFCNDLVFVPTSICYDRILEEKALLKEFGGEEKKDENFGQMVQARHFLKRKHGKIYINFSNPFSLKEYLEQHGGDRNEDMHKQLAFHVIRSINNVTMVTPLALIATTILARHRRGFYVSELTETAHIFMEFLKKQNTPLASTLTRINDTLGETLSHLINRKIVDFIEDIDGEETFYYVDEDKKPELEYYKNSIIHYFIPNAFLAYRFSEVRAMEKT